MSSWAPISLTIVPGLITQWEGGYRVPCAIRWPGVIKPGTVVNDIAAHEDMLPTLVAAAGDTTVKEDLLRGRTIGERTYKVHLDGHDLRPALEGKAAWPRKDFIYWTDDGSVAALRYGNWKATFLKQNAHGMHVWQQPFEVLRAPRRRRGRRRHSRRGRRGRIGWTCIDSRGEKGWWDWDGRQRTPIQATVIVGSAAARQCRFRQNPPPRRRGFRWPPGRRYIAAAAADRFPETFFMASMAIA